MKLLLPILDIPARVESRLVYRPSRKTSRTPAGAEDVWFETQDGLRLHGWFIAAPTASARAPAPAVLHLHGNTGNVATHAYFSRFLPLRGVSVLVFDYRSYGRSEPARGSLVRSQLVIDAHAALTALLARGDVDCTRIGVLGLSLGGVIGLALASERDEVRAVVSVAAFSSWKAIAGRYLGPFGRALTARGVDAEHCAARLGSRPLLLVHADGDRVVPPAHAEAIHISAIEAGVPCELLSPRASGHTIVATRKVIQRAIAEFFDTAFATEMDTTPAAARMGEYE